MSNRSKPDDYTPPYPAYQLDIEGCQTFACALIGVQYPQHSKAQSFILQLLSLFLVPAPGKPNQVDQCQHIDSEGYRNDICILYWDQAQDLRDFFERDDVQLWQNQPDLTGHIGWWRESFFGNMSSADISFAHKSRYGVSQLAQGCQKMQFHGYMGSMRDRVPDYLSGEADGDSRQLALQTPEETRGKHVIVDDLPHNLCYIRTAFGANHAPRAEQQAFDEMILPVLKDAAQYLHDQPLESNCISTRYVNDLKLGFDSLVEVQVLAWFMTLQDLERWTASHALHLAILHNAAKFHQRFDFKSTISQGHEVFVIPRQQVNAQYYNCHPKTGFLPYFSVREIS